MNWHKSTTTYQTQWQTIIEHSLEAGQIPLFDLGASPGDLPGLATLMALLTFADQRTDVSSPLIIAGGNSVGWLVGLLYQAQVPRVPMLTSVYSGVDPSTHMASSALYTSQLSGLPASLAPYVAPEMHSGAPLWDALPFALGAQPGRNLQTSADGAPTTTDSWLTWASVTLALALILLALLV
jgi:hypothetical protein